MDQKILNRIFIWGFLALYVFVALISFVHAISFFNIGNARWMSICLAGSFELGLALSLCSILLSDNNRRNTLPWILMIVLTFVQVVGNVYATFSHIASSDADYYQNLAKPLLFFLEDVPEDTVRIIISWIMGAILPVVALMMTDMVASNIRMMNVDVQVQSQILEPPVIKPEIIKKKDDSSAAGVAENNSDKSLESPVKSKKKFLTKLKDMWEQ